MKSFLRGFLKRALFSNSMGATLVEVTIAVVVLGLITASVPPVLVMISSSQMRHYEHKIAEDLTRNQLEYIKSTAYKWGNETGIDPITGKHKPVRYEWVVPPDENYGIEVLAQPVDPDTLGYLPLGEDTGIQEITVTIYGYSRSPDDDWRWILKTTDLKVARSVYIEGFGILR